MSTGQLRTEHTTIRHHDHHDSTESHTEQSQVSSITDRRPHTSTNIPQLSFTSTPYSNDSASASSTGKRQDALEIFEQYGISRPKGWLSRALSEEHPGSAGQYSSPQTKTQKVCHSCGANLNSQQYCSHCGHDSCVKCTSEIPNGDVRGHHFANTQEVHRTLEQSSKHSHHVDEVVHEHTNLTQTTTKKLMVRHHERSNSGSGTDTPNIRSLIKTECLRSEETVAHSKPRVGRQALSQGVRNHPFLVADREGKTQPAETKSTTRTVKADGSTQLSDCISHRIPPRQAQSSADDSSQSQGNCSNPSCRATHAGHHPFRHSISCAHRKAGQRAEPDELKVMDLDEEETAEPQLQKPPRSPLAKKIDQLFQHAEGLHSSQHIMEHLAAGKRRIDEASTSQQRLTDKLGSNYRKRHTVVRISKRPSEESSLAHQNGTLIDYDIASRYLSSDVESPDGVERKAHTLHDDPMVDRGVSPKSHELPDDIRSQVGTWVKPHSISQDPRFEVRRHIVKASRQSFPPPDIAAMRLWLDKPDMSNHLDSKQSKVFETHGIRPLRKMMPLKVNNPVKGATLEPDWLSTKAKNHMHEGAQRVLEEHTHSSQGQNSRQSLKHAATSVENPRLRKAHGSESEKVTETAPWKQRALRRVSRTTNQAGETNKVSDISNWRQRLRKVDRSEDRLRGRATTPPVVKWRRSLSKLPKTPQPDVEKEHSCKNCNPSESSSLKLEETTPGRVGYDELMATNDPQHLMTHDHRSAEYELTPSRLKLRQIEHSLAFKGPDDFTEQFQNDEEQQEAVEAREVRKTKHHQTRGHSSFEEIITEVHNPQPITSTNHVCAWRTRYMDLTTEVEHLKSEMSSRQGLSRGAQEQRRDAGVAATRTQHECPDIDIEGLTIVMHMRGKDDLVINTDLTKE
ncbi:Fc.00g108850.m01.CDS01 [Cosmosporella sp. VM-42]